MSSARLELGRHATVIRAILVVLGLPQAVLGLYALIAPQAFYDDFPAGRGWVAALGPFDEHLVIDVGALFLAIGVLQLIAAALPSRRLVAAALVAWLLFAVPHAIFHATELAPYGTGDAIANLLALAWTVIGAVLALVLLPRGTVRRGSRRSLYDATPVAGERGRGSARMPIRGGAGPDAGAAETRPLGAPRIPPVRPRDASLLMRSALALGRRRFGAVPTPFAVTAHHPVIFFGHGAFELAAERTSRVDARLKHLAVMKAAMLVGCEWCLDFGSATSAEHGVSEDDLRALPDHRESDRFSALEQLALDYAVAMTRTPVEVPDALVAQLREHLDDPQLVELTTHIALENYRARFNWALGIEGQNFTEGAYCARPTP